MEQDDAQKLFDKKIILFEEIIHRYETKPKTYKIQTEKSKHEFILIISNGSLDSIDSILISTCRGKILIDTPIQQYTVHIHHMDREQASV